jgi:hypothetical protein
MRDTSPKMIEKMHEMIQSKSPYERLLMGSSMYHLSKQIVMSSILKDYPDISKKELKLKVFERFYSTDFSKNKLEEILKHLDEHSK